MNIKMKQKILFLVDDLSHDFELYHPLYGLEWEGIETVISGSKLTHTSKFGRQIKCDITFDEVNVNEYNGIIIPGGFAPDYLRNNKNVLDIVNYMNKNKKLIASICHAAQVLISADIVRERKLTCVKQIAVDVINAGGIYKDSPVVIDENLITSRVPSDLPGFTNTIIKKILNRGDE